MKPYLLLLLILSGCTKEPSLQDRFINHNDYWAYYDELSPEFHNDYFSFNSDGKSNKYCRSADSLYHCTGGDNVFKDVPWSVKDSILHWGINDFYIVTANESVIVLYFKNKQKRHFFLVRESPGKLRKPRMAYHPEEN